MQLECKLRALAVLIAAVDDSGPPASQPNQVDLVPQLLGSPSVHSALMEVLRWVSGPLQTEMHRCRTVCPIAALDASDRPVAHAMLLVLAAALGLIARLLQAAHGTRCALHDALIGPGAATGAQCLGLCVLLHADIMDSTFVSRPSPTKPYDIALLELEVDVEPEGSTLLPLCPVGLTSVGPLAARSLALLCHAARDDSPSSGLMPHLCQYSPAISCTLRAWLESALAEAEAGDGAAQPLLETSCSADCASAALQLLGAAAGIEHRLFAALTRGSLLPGEAVRVQPSCHEPEGGWGLLSPGQTCRVRQVEGDAVFIDLDTHRLWVGARSSQLELSVPTAAKSDAAWESWDVLQERLGKDTPTATNRLKGDPPANPGPMNALLRIVCTAGASAANELRSSSLLQLQALMVVADLWGSPVKHAGDLRAFRKDPAFWDFLGAVVRLPDLQSKDAPPTASAALGWLRHALGVQILSRELALASGPAALEPAAARILSERVAWLARTEVDAMATSCASSLPSAMLSAPVQTSQLLNDLLAHAAAETGVKLNESNLPQLGAISFVCARVPAVTPPFSEHVEACTQLVMSLWAGGTRRAFPDAVLLDSEAIKLRAGRLREWRLRSVAAEASRGGGDDYEMKTLAAPMAVAAAEALAMATERIQTGDELAAADANMILDRLPGEMRSERTGNAIDLEIQQQTVVARVAATYNAGCLAATAHALMARSWRVLMGLVIDRRHIARLPAPAPPNAGEEATLRWLSGVSEHNTLETLAAARVTELASAQRAWAEQCTAARQQHQSADALDAAALLLSQQALALRTGTAFVWQILDTLISRPSWQTRYQHLRGKMDDEIAIGGSSAHRAERVALRETNILALQALLDDGKHSRPNETSEGWQSLHKLTAHVCTRLETSHAPTLDSASARSSLAAAVSELIDRDAKMKAHVARGTQWQEDAAAASLPEQLAALSRQLRQDVALPPPVATELRARAGFELLDSGTGSAAEILKKLVATPMSMRRDGSENDERHRLMGEALCKLARARESMLQEGVALRASCASAQRGSGAERRALLVWLAEASRTDGWAAAERVHKSLAAELEEVTASIAEQEDVIRMESTKAVEELLRDHRLEAAACALAECNRAMLDVAVSIKMRSELWARVQCCARVIELVRIPQDDDADAGEVVAALLMATAALQPTVGLPATSPSGSSSLEGALAAAVKALLSCEVSVQENEGKDAFAQKLEARAAQVHEVMCVVALALHHERTAAVPGVRQSSSTMLVRSACLGEAQPSFFLSFGSSDPEKQISIGPHGWCTMGASAQRAPPHLCALLWPVAPSALASARPASDSTTWHTMLPAALRAFALDAAREVAKQSSIDSAGEAFAVTAATLLRTLRALLKSSSTMCEAPSARPFEPTSPLVSADGVELLSCIATALASQPLKASSIARDSLVGSMILLLAHQSRCWPQSVLPTEHLQRLAQHLCLDMAADRSQQLSPPKLGLLAQLLPVLSGHRVEGAATRLMSTILHAPFPHSWPLLPALLRVANATYIAEEMLGAGLVRHNSYIVHIPHSHCTCIASPADDRPYCVRASSSPNSRPSSTHYRASRSTTMLASRPLSTLPGAQASPLRPVPSRRQGAPRGKAPCRKPSICWIASKTGCSGQSWATILRSAHGSSMLRFGCSRRWDAQLACVRASVACSSRYESDWTLSPRSC